VPDDSRPATLPDDLDRQTLAAQELGDSLSAGLDVRLVEGRERHARYPGQCFKVLAQGGHELADTGLQGT
jgi:hypothetical protein